MESPWLLNRSGCYDVWLGRPAKGQRSGSDGHEFLEQISAGRRHLVVDLQVVTFMDSTGLGVLVGRLKLVRVQDGTLKLVCTSERILKVFAITGLDKVFQIFDSIDEALAPAS